MIRAAELVYRRASGDASTPPLLDAVSFTIGPGELCLVAGPTGVGKSTLLHLLAGILRPSAGTIWIDGRPVSRFSALHRDLGRRSIGLVPQKLHLVEWLDVRGNVSLPHVARGVADATSLTALLDRLELAALADRPVSQLSGGERQRVALGRALVHAPPVLLLDEPTAHQDDAHAAAMLAIVAEARSAGATVVIAAHDARVEHWARRQPAASWHAVLHEGTLAPLVRLS